MGAQAEQEEREATSTTSEAWITSRYAIHDDARDGAVKDDDDDDEAVHAHAVHMLCTCSAYVVHMRCAHAVHVQGG